MTVLRQNAMRELERLPEDKIMFVLQIMQGINGLYDDNDVKRDAFNKLEHLRKKVEIDITWADVDQVVCLSHGIFIMFDDDQGVA